MKKIILFALLVLMLGACKSKPAVDTSIPPQYVLTFYKKINYPRGQQWERSMRSKDGKKIVWVEEKPVFHSKEVVQIIPLMTKDSMFDLRMKLTKRGARWWDSMIDYNFNEQIIVALDDMYLTEFKATFLTEQMHDKQSLEDFSLEMPEYVILKGPFNEELVRQMMLNVERNNLYYDTIIEERKKRAEEEAEFDPYKSETEKEYQLRKKQQEEMHSNQNVNPLKLF